ncbi:sugar phosphate nucleotidyltransferase [Candidatus Nitrosopelagicus sp.]|nr:sugar phosphate nucleotidyltransferase [Candidatus Nitrosopelagicus sp.]
MKCVILAGGLGTRITEESYLKPKPMIEVGGKPILWHIMKLYSIHGINDFIICCGYRGNVIREYFKKNNLEFGNLKMIDTGENTMTGGRLKRIEKEISETFCMTYGDGLSDINIKKAVDFHIKSKTIGTLTAVHPPERFGVLNLSGDYVKEFHEKLSGESSWINGGFFVFEPEIFRYLDEGDKTILEKKPLETLAMENQLTAYRHNGFWHPMDTLRDKLNLEKLWNSETPPWKNW